MLKDIELRLIAELMKDSFRSDRELAKAMGVSQPTVTRTRKRIKAKELIREYTVIPNFQKLGYQIFALTFATIKTTFTPEEAEKARKTVEQMAKESTSNIVSIERGMGLGFTVVIESFHEDYASYSKLLEDLKRSPYLENTYGTFLIDLNDQVHYRPLTFVTLADHLLSLRTKEPQ